VTFTWSGSDTDGTVFGYYYSFDHDPPNTWTTDTSATSGILSEGSHTFRIQALDDRYDFSTLASRTFTVLIPPAPVAHFSGTPTSGTAPLTVDFTDTSTGTVTSWEWDFDNDGTADSTVQNPSYTYSNPGSYDVKLTVTGPGGTDEEVKTNYIGVYVGIIYVDGNRPDDTGNGLTWATAKKYIQSGINAASNSWLVLVADGTYTGAGNKDLDFGGKEIWLRSQNGASTCIINCQNSGRGFYFHNSETNNAIVQGFTIQNGSVGTDSGGAVRCESSSPTFTNCTFSENSAAHGGAVRCYSSNPTITDCTFNGNSATEEVGGAVGCEDSSPTITNCTFSGNSAVDGGGAVGCWFSSSPTITDCTFSGNSASGTTYGYGGAVFCLTSSPTFTNCTISGNSADSGGGVYCNSNSSPRITNCIFSQNSAVGDGGGVRCYDSSSPTITDCTFSENSAGDGGAVSCNNSSPTITNCTFSENLASGTYGCGGAVCCSDSSSPTITNCTFSGNSAAGIYGYGGAVFCMVSSPTITNCILWNNSATGGGNEIYIYDSSSSVTLNNSDVTSGGYGGETGNITENSCIHSDPLFVNAAGGNYRLQGTSPCIDSGDNTLVPAGITTDLDGNLRIQNGTVDLGAYEYLASALTWWAKSYGGTGEEDCAYSIQQTSDGGYVMAGDTTSFGESADHVWIVKLNGDGTIAWEHASRAAGADHARSIQQTSDGGYVVAGWTGLGAGWEDVWVLKLNSDGEVAWQKAYGGADEEKPSQIQQTSDGGYIVAGVARSFGVGGYDLWVLKLNSTGTVSWQKTYGGPDYEETGSIQQTSDGGYIVLGGTSSFGAGLNDLWVLKLNDDGTVAWQKTYGGTDYEETGSIQQTSDGGYIVAGKTHSFGAGGGDFWVLKLDSAGTVEWEKTYGGTNEDYAYSIQQTADGGYVVAGDTTSFGAGGEDFWVLKLDSDGTILFNPASGAQMADTNATVATTSATVATTTVTGATTSATVTTTSAPVIDTNATVEQQAP
jgi:uncharacterized delta-60 repeat protein